LQAFWAFSYTHGYMLSLFERFETIDVDCTMVYKYIRTVVLFDKSETFVVVKPFYSAGY